jgi:2-methylisocitrate lyase-like PEP mutase family enzyme
MTISDRRARFRALHERGCFVIPNPWDRGSAVFLERLGFHALATTSAGFAFSQGLPDDPNALSLPLVLAHLRDVVSATSLPVNADFQNGYGATPDDVAASVRACVETGVAGLSIEDATGRADQPLYELGEALDRLRAARAAVDASGSGVLLTARAECFLVGHPDPLAESIRRVRAYAEAGADVLFAPMVREPDGIRAIVDAAAGKPVNLVVGWHGQLKVADYAALGVRRISVGGSLARAAWTAFMRAARTLVEGEFAGFDGLVPSRELNALFQTK